MKPTADRQLLFIVPAFIPAVVSAYGLQGAHRSLIGARGLKLKQTALDGISALRKTEWYTQIKQAANIDECSSPLVDWAMGQIQQMSFEKFEYMTENYIDFLAFEYKIFIDNNESGEYFGANGEHTNELIGRHQSTETFWSTADTSNSITTNDILLLGVHGQDLADDSKLIPTLQLLYKGYSSSYTPKDHADDVQSFIKSLPGGYSNPLLTGNALAVSEFSDDDLGTYPDSIVIGDGILSFLDDLGLDSDGPDFVHAHEFAHHLQYEMGEGDDISGLTEAEETRRLELMADAFSAYFLAHDDGGDMMPTQINELHETAFSTGDCDPLDEGHHGTPEQRKCAAIWGASEAAPDGVLLHPSTLLSDFDAALNDIIDLDEDTCKLVHEAASSDSWDGPNTGDPSTDPEDDCLLHGLFCNMSSAKGVAIGSGMHVLVAFVAGWLLTSA